MVRALYLLFFLSGFPALLYQIVWQRALFTVFGVNTESVTVVVCAFMLGLGAGSLAGGWLSKRQRLPVLLIFAMLELGIAGYGLVSLRLFPLASAGGPLWTFLAAFAMVAIPTMMMGATLPLLTAELVRLHGEVGKTVGKLYFVNTLGSAVACFAAGRYWMGALGMDGVVQLAAALNGAAALCGLFWFQRSPRKRIEVPDQPAAWRPRELAVAATAGFVSLGFELVWYRVYSFATGGEPRAFAYLLGSFLLGIALGGLLVRRVKSETATATYLCLSSCAAGLTAPFIASLMAHVDPLQTLPVVTIAAAMMGAVFPMLCQTAVAANAAAGAGVSYLYAANIAGSVAGSYFVGQLAFDLLPLQGIAVALSAVGIVASAGYRRNARILGFLAFLPLAMTLYDNLYERLMYEGGFDPSSRFVDVVETKGGVVTVDSERHIYGGGAHDGILTTDLETADSCIRPYSLSYLHPEPKSVLLVGVAGGAWTAIVGKNPFVREAVAVEINPGYLTVIGRYPEIAPILRDPKITLVVDDGRRWMRRNMHRKFDAIVMDTVQHWRSNATNLLSAEFFRLAKSMLNPGGIVYFNTTYSDAAMYTGAISFPYALRFGPFLAVSDSPLRLDERRWRAAVAGHASDARIERIAGYFRTIDLTGTGHFAVEPRENILTRTRQAGIITDANMLTEWRP
ncbi:MAG: spermidine synthase [Acidobacteria bacterium]|nr:spermidine synthase [Acidobacteriota bacterium]